MSNGYMSRETCDYIIPYLDAINIDLKSFNENFYYKVCKAKLWPVLDNISYLHKNNVWVEITTLVIPGENNSIDELKQIAQFIAGVSLDIPWHLSAFHADYQMTNKKPTSLVSLLKAKEIGEKAGLRYVYIGNVDAGDNVNTYCANCGELLIKRGYMSAEVRNMKQGSCGNCREKIAGIF